MDQMFVKTAFLRFPADIVVLPVNSLCVLICQEDSKPHTVRLLHCASHRICRKKLFPDKFLSVVARRSVGRYDRKCNVKSLFVLLKHSDRSSAGQCKGDVLFRKQLCKLSDSFAHDAVRANQGPVHVADYQAHL